jgi:hypothetical protein
MFNFQKAQFYETNLSSKHIVEEISGDQGKFTTNVWHHNSKIFSESSIASKSLNVLFLHHYKSAVQE